MNLPFEATILQPITFQNIKEKSMLRLSQKMGTLDIYHNLDGVSITLGEGAIPQQSIDLPQGDYNNRKHKVIVQASGQLSLILLHTLGEAPKLEIYDLFGLPIGEIKEGTGTVFFQAGSDDDTPENDQGFAAYVEELVHEATSHFIEVGGVKFETHKHRKALPKDGTREDRKAKVETKDIKALQELTAFLKSNL